MQTSAACRHLQYHWFGLAILLSFSVEKRRLSLPRNEYYLSLHMLAGREGRERLRDCCFYINLD
jgi:hypothetical protein